MLILFLTGTILDDVTATLETVRLSENYLLLALSGLFIIVSSFTLLNVMIGVMVDVVDAISQNEAERMLVQTMEEQLWAVFELATRSRETEAKLSRMSNVHYGGSDEIFNNETRITKE